jgi:excisionase family DNA binding protein
VTILTFHEAAQFLRVSERHLRDLVKLTDIPRRQTGRKARIFFVRERLSEWWDRASKPTPINIKVNTFKLLKRGVPRSWQV